MTQDQYGQARDSGYVVSGQAAEDEQTEEFSDGQEKKMTTFQKVASALRGDRPDRDTPDQDVPDQDVPDQDVLDQDVPGQDVPGHMGVAGQTPAGPDDLTDPGAAPDPNGSAPDPNGMATGQTSHDTFAPGTGAPDTFTPETGAHGSFAQDAGTHGSFARDAGTHEAFTRDEATQDTAGQDTGAFDARDSSLGVQDPTTPEGAAPGAGAARGDYWDVPDTHGAAQGQAGAVTSPDGPAADADPLARQDTANVQDPTVTQPDVYGTDATPVAATTDATNTDAGTAGTAGTGPTGTADAGAGPTAAYPQDGAATISDVPVTQTPAGPVETDAAGGAGRHAAAPTQELHPGEAAELHPGEAAGSLDNLGDLAYGKLIPDAADFTAQWREIQLKFVDDPQASVTEAAEVVEQVTAKMEAAIQERQRAIQERQRAIQEQQRSLRGRWGEDTQADTETLRATLRMYKAFLDQLVGPKV